MDESTSLFAPPLAERAARATNAGCDAGEAADRAVMDPLHVIYHDAQQLYGRVGRETQKGRGPERRERVGWGPERRGEGLFALLPWKGKTPPPPPPPRVDDADFKVRFNQSSSVVEAWQARAGSRDIGSEKQNEKE